MSMSAITIIVAPAALRSMSATMAVMAPATSPRTNTTTTATAAAPRKGTRTGHAVPRNTCAMQAIVGA